MTGLRGFVCTVLFPLVRCVGRLRTFCRVRYTPPTALRALPRGSGCHPLCRFCGFGLYLHTFLVYAHATAAAMVRPRLPRLSHPTFTPLLRHLPFTLPPLSRSTLPDRTHCYPVTYLHLIFLPHLDVCVCGCMVWTRLRAHPRFVYLQYLHTGWPFPYAAACVSPYTSRALRTCALLVLGRYVPLLPWVTFLGFPVLNSPPQFAAPPPLYG